MALFQNENKIHMKEKNFKKNLCQGMIKRTTTKGVLSKHKISTHAVSEQIKSEKHRRLSFKLKCSIPLQIRDGFRILADPLCAIILIRSG